MSTIESRPDRLAAARELAAVSVLFTALLAVGYVLDSDWAAPAATVVVVAVIALLDRRAGGSSLRRWLDPPRRLLLVLGVAIGTLLAVLFVTALVASLFGLTPSTTALDFVRGSVPGYLGMMVIAWTTAAFGEEILFRGFVLDRVAAVFGGSRLARGLALSIQAALFGVGHAYQGPDGMVLTGLVGACFAIPVLRFRGNLWVAILAHGLLDTLGLTMMFLGVDGGGA